MGRGTGKDSRITPPDHRCGSETGRGAGKIKTFHRMSLADCFAVALAKQQKADLYTGDPEFKAIEGEQKIVWL